MTDEGSLDLWSLDAKGASSQTRIGSHDKANLIALSPDGNFAASGDIEEGVVAIYDTQVAEDTIVQTVRLDAPLRQLQFTSDGYLLALSAARLMWLRPRAKTLAHSIAIPGPVGQTSVTDPAGRFVVALVEDGTSLRVVSTDGGPGGR